MNETTDKSSKLLELLVAILLGITAVLTAYASWQGSLYGGNQASKYTEGTAIISEANSLYNSADQYISQDMQTWDKISDLRVDIAFAESKNDAAEVERLQYKLDKTMYEGVEGNDEFKAAIEWADAQENYASPFDKEGYIGTYMADANAKYDEGQAKIKEGSEANALGDKLGLVTVVYAVVLFLLGMAAFFNGKGTRIVLLAVSVGGFIYATIMMFSVPMLTL